MKPPWQMHPDIPPRSIGWRMGRGEDYLLKFYPWFHSLAADEQKEFMERNPEPPDWRGFYSSWRASSR